ncbi:hypothetical protein B0T22DRAFT_161463 [Podospora appendiculata]|uniref:Uncharacterized protein n=1 Tax=Podospora appendiculata TaxID=314037 RepID=A0AAE0XAQ6_9PEZI|nr:hypothetical protein B0T22DRAFT_161463 [Podospora appendiculata]
MLWQSAIIASVLATGAHAGIGQLIVEGMARNSPSYERRMEEIAKHSLLARGILEARQTTGQGSDTVVNPDGSINMTAWDAQANSACIAALNALPSSSNPSGTCVCYNLPALDSTSGTFEADLRLFQLNQPTAEFLGIPPANIQVSLSYSGASVSPISSGTAAQKIGLSTRQNQNIKQLQTYLFVGQIDKTQMTPGLSMAQLQALVMPVVTLSGTNPAGQLVSTNVSSNEAAFVAGVFSKEVVMSSFAMAELAVEDEVARLKNGTTAFVLPGVSIMIFPVGFIITGLWTFIGVAAYAYGTYCRYSFRDQHRQRMLRQEKANVARF